MHFMGSLTVCHRYGRKTVICASILLKLTATYMTAFPLNYPWVVVTRFLLGVGSTGAYLTGFILSTFCKLLGSFLKDHSNRQMSGT